MSYKGKDKELPLLVVEGDGPPLIGRDWLQYIIFDWKEIYDFHPVHSKLQPLFHKYSIVLRLELGTFCGITADIHVDCEAQPRFYMARRVPYILKDKIELDSLVAQGVIQPVESSRWATPIVPVVKKDGSVRICGDYKLIANRLSTVDAYPLPKIEDLLTALSGGKTFTKLGCRCFWEKNLSL